MDPPSAATSPPTDPSITNTKSSSLRSLLLGSFLALLFPVVLFLSLALFLSFSPVLVRIFSLHSPVSLPSQCKIVSSSVDIRSSRVCELGLLNYNAKSVFSPSEKKRFRCRYDYYWASIFKVEYKESLTGQTRVALAEVPNEALPVECRPGFSGAWLTKERLKINKTYDCWYTSGISTVNIYHGNIFHCQARDPSTVEMIQRYYILFTKLLESFFTSKSRYRFWKGEVVAGVVTGFLTSLISIRLIRMLHSWCRFYSFRTLPLVIVLNRLKRACLFVAYVSFTLWLAIQYGKRLGFPVVDVYR